MPELAGLAAFLLLGATLVYAILRVELGDEIIDLRDRPAPRRRSFDARLLFVDSGARTVTVDGIAIGSGSPFAIEVGRPEGWTRDDADARLGSWATTGDVVEIRLHTGITGHRVWISDGEAAIDLPVAGMLGVQPAQS